MSVVMLENVVECFLSSDFVCYVVVNPIMGHYCGYVIVPYNHPAAGCEVMKAPCSNYHVHGGISYSERFSESGWAVGFDCAHYSDYLPYAGIGDPENEKGRVFVKKHLEHLAKQLREHYTEPG